MKTSEKILSYIQIHKQATGAELSDFLEITDRAVRKQLKSLIENNTLEKIGTPPKVFYRLNTTKTYDSIEFNKETQEILEKNFYNITPTGKELVGVEGFIIWCSERDFDIQKKADEFVGIIKKYKNLKKDNLLDATSKLKKTFDQGADELYYYDFYSVEVFGKTKMGQKLLYAKQSENKKLMKEIVRTIRLDVVNLIKKKSIRAVAYVQPTVPRQVQFMKVLEKELRLDLPIVKINKVISDIRVPQKTLKKLTDRIENANETFVVESNPSFKNVLLIDDAVGSGASINQVAQKIKDKGIAEKVIGFAVTGSLNDFDVISEV